MPRRLRLLLIIVALVAVAAACADDDDGAEDSPSAPTSSATDATATDETTDSTDEAADTAADEPAADNEDPTADYAGPVTELAIRLVDEQVGLDEFASRRDQLVSALTTQPGVGTDREFEAVLDGASFAPPGTPVFTGMTEYDDIDAFEAAAAALGAGPEAEAFSDTFEPAVFTALRPLDPADRYVLADIANQPGQILEVAVRDLSSYADFDPDAYEAARTVFLDALTSQPGVVAEYQWVSVLDPDLVVGMTVYDSIDALNAAAQSAELAEAAVPFVSAYPTVAGYYQEDARRTTVPGQTDAAAPVIQLAVRQPLDFDAWRTQLAAINSQLDDVPAIEAVAEYQPIFALAPVDPDTGAGLDDLYFTLIAAASEADVDALAAQLFADPDEQTRAFLSTFSPLIGINIQPYRDTGPVDVAELVAPGQVLEIAIRDVRGFESFEAFDEVRAAAVAELVAQPGVVRELEFRSTDGNYYVGMTLYDSVEAFESIAAGLADPSPAFQALFGFPPDVNVYGVTFDPAAG